MRFIISLTGCIQGIEEGKGDLEDMQLPGKEQEWRKNEKGKAFEKSTGGGTLFLERRLSGRRSPGSLALQTHVIEQWISKGVQRPLGSLKTLSGLHEVKTISTAVLRCSHSLIRIGVSQKLQEV